MRNGFKKITALLMAALMLLAALPASALGTEQYSNKVLPGISLASIVEPDTPVVTYVFMKGEEEISRQSVKDGDTLVEPEVTTGPNEKFVGWEPAVTFGTVSGVTETKTVTVKAKIETVYHVFFADESGRVVVTREGKTGDTIDGFDDVTNTATTLIPLEANKGITGWRNASGEKVTSVTLAESDVTLTAIIEEGYWITFESNGGSYVAPMFFTAVQTASAPATNPTKPGFTFDNWYSDESLNTKANFATIKSNKTLYAGWTSRQVSYTVNHWWENADDDGYSYKESELKYGDAGTTTNETGKTYEGFTVNTTDKPIVQQTIAGDGSTIVNVYYKRNVYEINFYHQHGYKYWDYVGYNESRIFYGGCFSSNGGTTLICGKQEDDVLATITAKYGENIRDKWPTYNNSRTWRVEQNSSTCQSNIDTMPLGGDQFYGPRIRRGSESASYYVEVLPGESGETYNGVVYKLDHTDSIVGTGWKITDDDKYAITGFTYKEFQANEEYEESSSGAYKPTGEYLYSAAKFYYTRNTYRIYYNNGVKVVDNAPYKYQADISNADDYVPTEKPEGKEDYVFEGWYADLTCTVKYEFNGKKMPADNIIVYAKWIPPVYTVTVYDADKTTVLATFKDIPKGKTIAETDMPRDKVTVPQGGEFLGWVDKDTEKPFHFDTQITKDYNLYAKVGSKDGYTVAYNANGGSGTVPTDSTTYAVGSSAVVQGKGEMIAPANDPAKSTFLGWAKSDTATKPDYLPGESMEIAAADAVNGVITLYAVWGPAPATTTLTYNANYGETPATVSHEVDGSTELPNNAKITLYGEDTFTRPGYKLVGWANNADATIVDYALGEEVIVDNNNLQQGEVNVLYAVWEKTTVILTIKKVVAEGGDQTKQFTFTGSYTESGATASTVIDSFSLKNGDTKVIEVPIGATLTITETDAADYTTTATYGTTSCTVADNDASKTISGITVNETDTLITVTNTIKTGELVVKKNVTGGWGDKSKRFSFTHDYGNGEKNFYLSDYGKGKLVYTLTGIPYGTVVTITEADYSGEGYTTTNDYVENGGNTTTVTISAASTTVTFTNTKEANPDTGVLLDSLPYILILAAIAVVVGVVVVRKRRSRDDD